MDKRTTRLFEAMRWLMFGERRAGALGRTTAFIGSPTPQGGQRMEISAEGWRDPDGQLLEDKEVIQTLASTEFGLRTVAVVPEVAPFLFQGAVEQVEAAHGQLMEAARQMQDDTADPDHGEEIDEEEGKVGREDQGEDDDNFWFQFILATSALDKSLRYSSASIMLSLAAAEAQVNAWAESLGGWALQNNGRSEDWLPLVEKLATLVARKGSSLDKGGRPTSDLATAVRQRNDLVHSKPVEQSLPLGSLVAREPARWLCVEARRAAVAVRESLVEVAATLDLEPPHYLIYCPEAADPDDDSKWLGVVMGTGMRDDSVFPKVSERLQGSSGQDQASH